MSCFALSGSRWNRLLTLFASEPGLACWRIATFRSEVLPSCRKKIRWPTPHSGAVRNSVGKPHAHVVDQQVGEEVHLLIAQRRHRGVAGGERRRMAERAADVDELLPAPRDGVGTARRSIPRNR